MGTLHDARRAQALLLAGLLGLVALATLLLLDMRAGGGRGRAPDALAPSEPERAPLVTPDELAPADASAPRPAPERIALAPAATEGRAPSLEFDPAALVGRVGCLGEPVADVTLWLFEQAQERRARGQPLASTRSDAEGRFRFTGLTPFRAYVVHAQHPEHLPVEAVRYPGHDELLVLERAASVRGLVRSRLDGRPVGGVEVALERWHLGPDGPRERIGDTTDAEGRWELPWAEPGMQSFLVLRPGFLPERHEFQVRPEGGEGYVIELDAGPLVELELYALEDGALLADTEVLQDEVLVRTDALGRLRLPLPAAGRAEDSVRISLARVNGCLTQGRLAREQARGPVRVPLALGGRVTGRVLDAAGQGVAGALVRLTGGGRAGPTDSMPEGFWLTAPRTRPRTGPDGDFLLSGLPPREGTVELRVQHADHPPGRSEPFESPRAGETRVVDVTLARGATIVGEVRVDGEPASARVHWEGERAGGWARANDRGAYRIQGVPAGEVSLRPRLDEEDEDVPRAEDTSLSVEEGAELVADFDLQTSRVRITGRVVDAEGLPVAEAAVTAMPSEELEGFDEVPYARSRADGRFALLVPEMAGLRFDVAAEIGPRRAERSGVRPGSEIELVLPAVAPVALRVVDALEHEPVLGFQVYWRASEGGSFARLVQGGRQFSPGPDGIFVAELPCGRIDLAVSARERGLVPERLDGIDVAPSRMQRLDFELEPGLELEIEFQVAPEHADALRILQRGRFALASEEQWSDRARGGAFFQDEVRNAQALRPDANRVARLEAMASGSYRFFNAPRGYRFRPRTFEVPPVAQHRLSVVLEPDTQ